MWIRVFKIYTIKMNVIRSFVSKVWNWQLKLRNKYYKVTLYYQRCAVTNFFTPSPQSFLRYINVLSYFQCKKRPAVSMVISKHYKLLIAFIFFRRQNTLQNGKTNRRISSNFCPAALWSVFCSHNFFFCSILAQSDDDHFCVCFPKNTVGSRYQRAVFCIEYRFGITATTVNISLLHFDRFATLIGWWFVEHYLVLFILCFRKPSSLTRSNDKNTDDSGEVSIRQIHVFYEIHAKSFE